MTMTMMVGRMEHCVTMHATVLRIEKVIRWFDGSGSMHGWMDGWVDSKEYARVISFHCQDKASNLVNRSRGSVYTVISRISLNALLTLMGLIDTDFWRKIIPNSVERERDDTGHGYGLDTLWFIYSFIHLLVHCIRPHRSILYPSRIVALRLSSKIEICCCVSIFVVVLHFYLSLRIVLYCIALTTSALEIQKKRN